jgi:uncharacterized protein (DUF169 family)
MKSVIAEKIHLKYEPVSITLSDDKPDNAVEFKPGKYACVMSLLATAVKGRAAVGSRSTIMCPGGGTGLGFGNQFSNLPGGLETFCRFLSTGAEGDEAATQITERIRPFVTEDIYDNFRYGERFKRPLSL